jgi:hypothetical protein
LRHHLAACGQQPFSRRCPRCGSIVELGEIAGFCEGVAREEGVGFDGVVGFVAWPSLRPLTRPGVPGGRVGRSRRRSITSGATGELRGENRRPDRYELAIIPHADTRIAVGSPARH